MVAEILQYIADGIKIKSAEADAMYAGIVIDTNNFKSQAGVRTFEAAAFLRRNGADVTRVRKDVYKRQLRFPRIWHLTKSAAATGLLKAIKKK